LKQADQTYRKATLLALWEVRYFRPLQKEEYLVFVDPVSGEVFGFQHVLDENAPGASLSPDQARSLAEQVVAEHGYRLADFDLQSSDATKRKAREDYTLVWQAKAGDPRNVGDSHYRLEVEIAGEQGVGFARSFKLPEEWERKEEGRTIANNVLMGVSIATLLVLVAAGLIVFVSLVRSGEMQWKRTWKFGVLLALLSLVGSLNGLPLIYRNYDTSVPLSVWKLQIAVGVTVVPVLLGLLGWMLIGCAISLYPNAWNLLSASARRVWRRDALVALVLSLAAGAGLARLDALLTSYFHAYAPIKDELFPMVFSTAWPAAGVFVSILTRTLIYAALAGVIIFILRVGWNRRVWWLWPGLALVLLSLGPTQAHSLAAFGVGWLMGFLPLLVAEPLLNLFAQANAFYLHNGVALALLTGIVLGWMLWPSSREADSVSA
jgi:hypothetical protein